MNLTSISFAHNTLIPQKYSCDGENTNPPLAFTDVPETAESLVLLMDDPDVPKNIRPDGMWDHWVLFNIPPAVRGIPEGEMTVSGAVLGLNSSGKAAYQGPCPPDGEHRYFFRLYALDTTLEPAAQTTKSSVLAAIDGHVIAQTELIGRYKR